jgi:probable HAF family extracellular repeat protein
MIILGLVRRLSPVTRLAFALALVLAANVAKADALYSVTDLGALDPLTLSGTPRLINGQLSLNDAKIYTGPTITSTDPGFSQTGNAIQTDSKGTYTTGFVGSSGLYNASYGFLSDGTTAHPLETIPTQSSDVFVAPYGVNASGQVVGAYQTDSRSTAFLYSDSKGFTWLGTPGANSWAEGINSLGQVVGAVAQGSNAGHAVLFQGGGYTDLNTLVPPGLGWTLGGAWDISDSGQILAVGWQGTNYNNSHAFLLTPQAVPEPASLALWGIVGVVSLACMHRHRRRRAG